MDVSDILAAHAASKNIDIVEKENPLQLDTGLLTVTDPNTIDGEAYSSSLETHLLTLAQSGVQALIGALFSLPTTASPDGPLAHLPAPVYPLPRAHPLPRPKPKTKWELFAAAKGIQKQRRDRKEWDDEKQEWVNRWGWHGKNKEPEEQWLTEVKMNADPDFDPRKEARDARKTRVAKNEKQHQQNLDRAAASSASSNSKPTSSDPSREAHKNELAKTVALARASTASMGKFDKTLDGEKKLRGLKRKFDPTETPVEHEKQVSLSLLTRMESDAKKMRHTHTLAPSSALKGARGARNSESKSKSGTGSGGTGTEEGVLNVRKAVRFASRGEGGASLGRKLMRGGGGRGGRGGAGGRGRGRGRGGSFGGGARGGGGGGEREGGSARGGRGRTARGSVKGGRGRR